MSVSAFAVQKSVSFWVMLIGVENAEPMVDSDMFTTVLGLPQLMLPGMFGFGAQLLTELKAAILLLAPKNEVLGMVTLLMVTGPDP
jgi:hypothetical protein